MKKIFLLFLTILFCSITNAKSYLSRFVTDDLLINIYGSQSSYIILSGGFNSIDEYYPNTKFQGYISPNIKLTIETGRDGCVKLSTLEYEKISSEQQIKSIIESTIRLDHIKVQAKKIHNNGQFDNGISIEGTLPSPPLRLHSAYIDTFWDYNDFRDFFFRSLCITYISSGHN